MQITDQEFNAAMRWIEYVAEASVEHKIPAHLILGVMSRESACGLKLTPKGDPAGTGDFVPRGGRLPPDGKGFGRGLMQIDYDAHPFARTGNWEDPRENILYGAGVLAQSIRYMRQRGAVDEVRAGLCGYNRGPGKVWQDMVRGYDCDRFTTGRNYGTDTLIRARLFILKLDEETDGAASLLDGPYRPSPYIDGLKKAQTMPPENIHFNVNTDLPTKQSGKAAA